MSQLKRLTEQAQSPVSKGKEVGRLASVLYPERLFGGLAATSRGGTAAFADRDLVWRNLTRELV